MKPNCKGRVYRCRINNYVGNNGEIVAKTSFIPLLRKSCRSEECQFCGWQEEDVYNLFPLCKNPKHGAMYRLDTTNVTTDWETGIVDGWDLELVEVKE